MNGDANIRAILSEAYRRSEKRLDTQQALAVAADQRSLVLAGVSVAGAAFVGDASLSLQDPGLGHLSSFGFAVAAVLSILSSFPQKMFTSGSHARDLFEVMSHSTPFEDVLRDMSENNDACIDRNEEMRTGAMRYYRASLGVFIASTLVLMGITVAPVMQAALTVGG